jgi:cytoskeletal protein CcmA (bactofilin family)
MQADNVNLITAGSKFEGTVEFSDFTRFEGYIRGHLKGLPGSQLILGENGVVEGSVEGDTIIIDGFVRGDIAATTKVVISETGRVIGQIKAPSVAIKFGGYFDGKCEMNN